jgi:hypothetical protein
MGFGQSKLGISRGGDILRIPQKCQKYRYAKISKQFYGPKNL